MNARIAADEIAEGYFLQFGIAELAEFEEEIATDNWWSDTIVRLALVSPTTIMSLGRKGLRKADGSSLAADEPFQIPVGVSLTAIANKLLDALCLSVHGITHAELETRIKEGEVA